MIKCEDMGVKGRLFQFTKVCCATFIMHIPAFWDDYANYIVTKTVKVKLIEFRISFGTIREWSTKIMNAWSHSKCMGTLSNQEGRAASQFIGKNLIPMITELGNLLNVLAKETTKRSDRLEAAINGVKDYMYSTEGSDR